MPVILRYKGYKLFFYSNEGNPLEPLHIHVRKGESVAKFWIAQDVSLASSYGLSATELNDIAQFVHNNREIIERAWNEFFG
ncbi:hypothetical protein SFMTTN_3301 [Sulfuriferula multivorans]|uniref:DUF4160 domain-containing protein n=1 Tax=Sulfuriferula multivorans TaxID=1559896 RepID=A0A401JHI3_9PROT|nr:DUF4160 domain-containing protein [Sulfuriferula multivorans]GBL47461.1 hypothetical protein SFMTTN_3301 [Sulfuriferula multivorans]